MSRTKITLLSIICLLLVACVPTTAASPQTTIVYPTMNAELLTAWAPATLAAARMTATVTPQPAPPEPITTTVEVVGQYTNTVEQWRPQIDEWAVSYDVDRDVIATVLQVQTCGNKHFSHDIENRHGLFGVKRSDFASGLDPYDLDTNVKVGMGILDQVYHQTNEVGLVFAGWKSRNAMISSFDAWPREAMRFYWDALPIYNGAKSGDGGAAAREWLASPNGQYLCNNVKIYQ